MSKSVMEPMNNSKNKLNSSKNKLNSKKMAFLANAKCNPSKFPPNYFF